MAYPILDLRGLGLGARAYVEGLEDCVVKLLGGALGCRARTVAAAVLLRPSPGGPAPCTLMRCSEPLAAIAAAVGNSFALPCGGAVWKTACSLLAQLPARCVCLPRPCRTSPLAAVPMQAACVLQRICLHLRAVRRVACLPVHTWAPGWGSRQGLGQFKPCL